MSNPIERLATRQRDLLDQWLPGHVLLADLSWGLLDRVVVVVEQGGRRLVLKAGGPGDHHEAREIHAYLHWATPWIDRGRAPRMTHHDVEARVLVVEHLPGTLVLHSERLDDPDIYRQAGRLLDELHSQGTTHDPAMESRENERALLWLGRPHRIPHQHVERLRQDMESWPTPPTLLVPTHGDYHPRNWLVDDDGILRIIDLGRAAMRPAATDLLRLDSREFRRSPELETAFLEGYGADPREPSAWRRMQLREGIGTAAWSHQVGDAEFEQHGLDMIVRALEPPAEPPSHPAR